MKFHRGRLFDHVHLEVSDLETSLHFYRAVLGKLDSPIEVVEGPGFFFADELFVTAGSPVSKIHLAFQAGNRDLVHRFHETALSAGGVDNGAPGERKYHPGYYAAYVLDPDGNNIEAVFHGEAERSAESVVITPVLR